MAKSKHISAAVSKGRADELVSEIRRMGQTHGLNNVFTTFLELAATSFASQTDILNADKRAERYRSMTENMPMELQGEYGRLCLLLFMAIQDHRDDPIDILGAVYHELRLNNEWNGQFFTPDNISRMMAMMNGFGNQKESEEKPYVTISDSACGSGTMLVAAAWAMLQNNCDYTSKCLCVAQDIDIRCVWMAYVQLALYGIPAVVIHGNSLTTETWDKWYTPNYWSVVQKGVSQ